MKVGILGGTFNPIHIGHITIAEEAINQYHLDEIWFMPNNIPYYKDKREVVSNHHREQMIKLAIENYPYFKFSDFEFKIDGHTYSSETLPLLKKQYNEHDFYFIMGADSLFHFQDWKNPEIILDYVKVLVANRCNHSQNSIVEKISSLNHYYNKESFYNLKVLEVPCSSSCLRCAISNKDDLNNMDYIRKYIQSNVLKYIQSHHLYL